MPVTPTSSAALAAHGAKALVAKAPEFQDYIGLHHQVTANEANALNHIFIDELLDHENDVHESRRPFALVTTEDHEYVSQFQCNSPQLVTSGGILVLFVDNARFTDIGTKENPGPDSIDDSWTNNSNWVYGTIDDFSSQGLLQQISFQFNQFSTFLPPVRSALAERPNIDIWLTIINFQFDPSA